MASPAEHRDVMAAAAGWTGETVAQVSARYKDGRDGGGKKRPRRGPGQPSTAQLDQMKALLAKGKQRQGDVSG
jgi:hypothetical protein